MDSTKILQCPACGHTMRKVNISEAGFTIDMCTNGCGGILFDNQELKTIFSKDEVIDKIIHYLENSDFNETNTDKVRVCPVCDTPMVKTGGASGVEIDCCNVCGAAFLDNEELKKLKQKS